VAGSDVAAGACLKFLKSPAAGEHQHKTLILINTERSSSVYFNFCQCYFRAPRYCRDVWHVAMDKETRLDQSSGVDAESRSRVQDRHRSNESRRILERRTEFSLVHSCPTAV
jgi:hypothetical protein